MQFVLLGLSSLFSACPPVDAPAEHFIPRLLRSLHLQQWVTVFTQAATVKIHRLGGLNISSSRLTVLGAIGLRSRCSWGCPPAASLLGV